jgi:hypothetical protein
MNTETVAPPDGTCDNVPLPLDLPNGSGRQDPKSIDARHVGLQLWAILGLNQ